MTRSGRTFLYALLASLVAAALLASAIGFYQSGRTPTVPDAPFMRSAR